MADLWLTLTCLVAVSTVRVRTRGTGASGLPDGVCMPVGLPRPVAGQVDQTPDGDSSASQRGRASVVWTDGITCFSRPHCVAAFMQPYYLLKPQP
eukprot:COSAG03_NODE_100_length_12949_cov_130.139611_15_plen_95_part_00